MQNVIAGNLIINIVYFLTFIRHNYNAAFSCSVNMIKQDNRATNQTHFKTPSHQFPNQFQNEKTTGQLVLCVTF